MFTTCFRPFIGIITSFITGSGAHLVCVCYVSLYHWGLFYFGQQNFLETPPDHARKISQTFFNGGVKKMDILDHFGIIRHLNIGVLSSNTQGVL